LYIDRVVATYNAKQDGKANINALETLLEQANAKAMAAAFKDDKAFAMPDLLKADSFK
jgi:hypothetical protein